MTLLEIRRIYEGSDGQATVGLYQVLEACGPRGLVAVNLFRAQKCSARAKVYRGGLPGRGSYRGMAYERKQWAMTNLAAVLLEHAPALQITWGWKHDPAQAHHAWVLYVDLPTGQVSFHTDHRGVGPDYPTDWDGVRQVTADRILRWIDTVLARRVCASSEAAV